MKKKGKFFLVIMIGITVFIGSFVIWALDANPIMSEATNAMNSDENVTVTDGDIIIFTPKILKPSTGLIFYPGGRVNPKAYAPLAKSIANLGYLVVIVTMPLNLAVLSPNKAESVIVQFSEISNWVIGGHSLGGSFAANYAFTHPNDLKGLILLASYPPDSNNLTTSSLAVLSIYGSNDGLISKKISAEMHLLPTSAQYLEIVGGNHAQFGYYGDQEGDNPATISREIQQSITVNAINLFLYNLG